LKKRLKTLSKITSPTPEDEEKINNLKTMAIPELKKVLIECDDHLADVAAEHGTIHTEGTIPLVAERNAINDEIKDIKTFDIPLLEKDLEKSEKLIETYKDNIKKNEIIARDTEQRK
jgi:hypothetical protein